MQVPGMYEMAEVRRQSKLTEEDVFNCGIDGDIVFLVVVPEIGACRVPVAALSHFMAGADEYAAEGMPEHWNGALSGKWTIKRERLRILANSWETYFDKCQKLLDDLDALEQEAAPAGIQFIDHEAGAISTSYSTQAEYDKQQADKRERQSTGYFTMREVAQILADTYNLDAAALLKTMKADYHAGKITVRGRDTEAPVLPDHTLRDFYDWMFPDDIRAMLKHWRWKREFPFPVAEQATQAAPVLPAGTSGGTEKKWTPEKLAELRSYRDKHTMPETAKHFSITGQRIRQLLPGKKPKANPFNALIHRM